MSKDAKRRRHVLRQLSPVRYFGEWAKVQLKRDDNLVPVTIVSSQEESLFCPLDRLWGDVAQRQYMFFRLGTTLGYGIGAERLMVICDAWHHAGESKYPSLADDPDSDSAILVMEFTPEGLSEAVAIPYVQVVPHHYVFKNMLVPDVEQFKAETSFGQFFAGMAKAEQVVEDLAERNGYGEEYDAIGRRAARTTALEMFGMKMVRLEDLDG
jgi:hypothetical protein